MNHILLSSLIWLPTLAMANQPSPKQIVIQKGSSFYHSLVKAGVPKTSIITASRAARPHANLARLRPGTLVEYHRDQARSEQLKIHLSARNKLTLKNSDDGWLADLKVRPLITKLRAFSGGVLPTLWEAALAEKMDPNIIHQLAEIFAWQVDFSRQLRPLDQWRLTIEQKLLQKKGSEELEHYGWGDILAAEIVVSKESYKAVRYTPPNMNSEYYNLDGENLRGIFLKSPLRYSRISSRFKRKRFHPVLKINRPHYGVDYAAATGTPVRSVGKGKIIAKGYNSASGWFLKIRHNKTYKTAYKHLRGFAKGIRRGKRVDQGQVIGYVGSSGLATGPHLHFEFYQKGRFVDPLSKRFPREAPVPKRYFKTFAEHCQEQLGQLPEFKSLQTKTSADAKGSPPHTQSPL